MYDSEHLADDVPVADAAEQNRAISEPDLDEEVSVLVPDDRPLEASAADWQEQHEAVDADPEEFDLRQ